MLLALMLAGCGDTMVYLPEEPVWVVAVPARETEPSAEPVTESSAEMATEERLSTAKIQFGGKSSADTGLSGPGNITESMTVTRPTEDATQPKETNPKNHSITVTRPVILATEPAATEGKRNSVTITRPSASESATEPPETPIEPSTEPPGYDISGYQPGALEYAIAEQLNDYRGSVGMPGFAYDPDLCAIASYRSFEISRVWSHTRPDGRSYTTVLSDFDYRVSAAAELLGFATADASAIAAKWIGSEDHQEILLGDFDTIGVGIYQANGVTYVTCLLVG